MGIVQAIMSAGPSLANRDRIGDLNAVPALPSAVRP